MVQFLEYTIPSKNTSEWSTIDLPTHYSTYFINWILKYPCRTIVIHGIWDANKPFEGNNFIQIFKRNISVSRHNIDSLKLLISLWIFQNINKDTHFASF